MFSKTTSIRIPLISMLALASCIAPDLKNGKAGAVVDRNKPVTIPRDIVDGDIRYLREKFLQSFDYSKNIKLTITFQRYDSEWEMFTDLEEDARIEHKD